MTRRISSPDTNADIELRICLDAQPRVSFAMIAGAGSGKTTSLVKALDHLLTARKAELKRMGQKVACITYTEIAAEQILQDVSNSPLVHVSTIHSFLWELAQSFQQDLKKGVIKRVQENIKELEDKAANYSSRVQQRTKDADAAEIIRLKELLITIESVPSFNYGTGSDYAKGILGHADIIDIVTRMIQEKPLFRAIISQKYPYIFVDESQDTFPEIVSAFKSIDSSHPEAFCLGFFGDPMQKIYVAGIGDIAMEAGWQRITKRENFRCSKPVLDVINAIRLADDGLQQVPGARVDAEGRPVSREGSVQLFVLPVNDQRTANLRKVREWCASNLHDDSWLKDDKVKIFVVVHRMAATRLGFPNLYSAMNDNAPEAFKQGFQEATAWPLQPLVSFVLPLVRYAKANKHFDVLSLLRSSSPLLAKEALTSTEVPAILRQLKAAVDLVVACFDPASAYSLGDVLQLLHEQQLCVLDSRMVAYIKNRIDAAANPLPTAAEASQKERNAMAALFNCPAKELTGYAYYIEDESPFATQQGVKGDQFDRVLNILDDDEGTHTQFSYDKYFGLKELSERDQSNIDESKDNVISRTRRLFYVSCSRAKKDLATVYFTGDVAAAVEKFRAQGIFPADRIFTEDELR